MHWLLFLCTSGLTFSTTDYMTNAVIDHGGLYVSRLIAADIERIDMATGETSIVLNALPLSWDVQNGFLATADTAGRPDNEIKHIRVHDGSVYWLELDGRLQRSIVGGGTAETIAEHVVDYTLFEDRVVFITSDGLFSRRLTDVQPVLVLARHDLDSVGTVTADSILVTAFDSPQINQGEASVLRVSWSGVAETIYETTAITYHNPLSVRAIGAGGAVYVARTTSGTYHSTLFVVRDGVIRELDSVVGPVWLLAASEDAITFAQWGIGTGIHQVMHFCVSPQRRRIALH